LHRDSRKIDEKFRALSRNYPFFYKQFKLATREHARAMSDVSDSSLASSKPGGYLPIGEAFVDEGLDLLDLLVCVSSSQIRAREN
jgi:hypothetical protein